MSTVTSHRLGLVEYVDGLALQNLFSQSRRENLTGDTLLLLQHPAVLTMGRGAKDVNVLAAPERLLELGVTLHHTDRGGDVTYHGPGQLVGYPLLHLVPGEQDVRRYVRRIEETMIRTVAHFGITATRIEKWPGVWVEHSRLGGPRKIAALGVHLSRWFTRHGFALNVEPDLSHYELIVPCGIREAGVTSMAAELSGSAPSMAEVEAVVERVFGEVFEKPVEQGVPPDRTISVAVLRGDQVLTMHRTPERGGFWQLITGRVEAGESPAQTAQRELKEETRLSASVVDLGYRHAFALGEHKPPVLIEETAFSVRVDADAGVTPDSQEHDGYEWLPFDAALERLPFEGLRHAVRLAYR